MALFNGGDELIHQRKAYQDSLDLYNRSVNIGMAYTAGDMYKSTKKSFPDIADDMEALGKKFWEPVINEDTIFESNDPSRWGSGGILPIGDILSQTDTLRWETNDDGGNFPIIKESYFPHYKKPTGVGVRKTQPKPVQTLSSRSGDNVSLLEDNALQRTMSLYNPPSMINKTPIRFRRTKIPSDKTSTGTQSGYEQINPDGSIEYLTPKKYHELYIRQPNYGNTIKR